MPAKPIPPGYHAVTPYLTVRGAARAIDFYKRAFGATEQMRMPAADGERLMHAEIRIGDSVVMLSDEFPEMGGGRSPESLGGAGGALLLYVDDVDATFRQALAGRGEGLEPERPPPES